MVLKYRGREIGAGEVSFIRELIAARPWESRRGLSLEVCRAWNWIQPNGTLCDALCRGLLLALHRSGQIDLPPARKVIVRTRRKPGPVVVDSTPLSSPLGEIAPVVIRQVRRTAEEGLVNGLIAQYHYLGFAHPVGESLKYLVTTGGRPIAVFVWSSAPRHLGPRDRHIGWSPVARRANIRHVAYQSRFLILPWVRVPHLASHLPV